MKSRVIQGEPEPRRSGPGGRSDDVHEAVPVVDIRAGSMGQPPDVAGPPVAETPSAASAGLTRLLARLRRVLGHG